MKFGPRPRHAIAQTMAKYRLSRRAAADLEAIAEYTIERYGVEQAHRYREELKSCFAQLAENATLGRRAEHLARGLLRFEHQSHVVFYIREQAGLLIVRILHSRMDVPRHF